MGEHHRGHVEATSKQHKAQVSWLRLRRLLLQDCLARKYVTYNFLSGALIFNLSEVSQTNCSTTFSVTIPFLVLRMFPWTSATGLGLTSFSASSAFRVHWPASTAGPAATSRPPPGTRSRGTSSITSWTSTSSGLESRWRRTMTS